MSRLTIYVAEFARDFPTIQAIRYTVFQVEQGVPAALEFDGKDEQSQHLLAYLDEKPIGTTRIRQLTCQLAKIERLAVLPEARGQGIARKLMQAALELLGAQQVPEVMVHAQEYVKDFYQSLGFVVEGDRFEEAGIPHVKMRQQLIQA